MRFRLFSKINELGKPLKVKHYVGLPPELTEGKDLRELLEAPVVILIGDSSDGVFLNRYDRNGKCVGDTWHMTVEDAKEQALFEYGSAIVGWKDVPDGVSDAVSFGLSHET